MKFQILMLLFLIMSSTALYNVARTEIKIKNMLCMLMRVNCDRDDGTTDAVVDNKEGGNEEAGDDQAQETDGEQAPQLPGKNYSINNNKYQSRIFLSGSLSERDINLIKFSLQNKIVFS